MPRALNPLPQIVPKLPVVLLTGFGPFPGVPDNASAQLVLRLVEMARDTFGGVDFVTEIFPADWQAAPERLSELFSKHQPILMLHFGVARAAQGFRIETQGTNTCRMTRDATGAMPLGLQLLTNGKTAHPVTIPTRDIVERLSALGIPASLSEDAGSYLCNAILYHSLLLSRRAMRQCRAGFIHIPADLSGPPLDEAAALKGGLEIIRVCLEKSGANTS